MKKFALILLLASAYYFLSAPAFCETRVGFDSSYIKANISEQALYTYREDKKELINARKAEQIAKKLLVYTNSYGNFSGFEQDKVNSRLLYRSNFDSTATFEINTRTGEFLFDKGIGPYDVRGDTSNLPDEKEAVRIAKQHLNNLGLLPSEEELEVSHVGGLGMSVLNNDGTTSDYKKQVTVYFSRKINNVPVVGASRIVVDMGSSGELVGLIKNWRKIDKSKTKKLSKNEFLDARARYDKMMSGFRGKCSDAKAVKIKQSQLVLYDDGKGVIEPAIFSVADLIVEKKVITRNNGTVVQKSTFFSDEITPLSKNPKAIYPYAETAP